IIFYGLDFQSALFNFNSFLTVVLLGICSCTYLKMQFPALLEQKTGFRGFFWKAARIGERLSPWVAVGCFTMGGGRDKGGCKRALATVSAVAIVFCDGSLPFLRRQCSVANNGRKSAFLRRHSISVAKQGLLRRQECRR
ncbi:hypothetical protein HYC85_021033, partial [Camellia sinensis]